MPEGTTWAGFAEACPELAATVAELFGAHKHHVMATLRRDGAPRLSGTEVSFDEGDLRIGIMDGAIRAADLRRDPRCAIHSEGADPDGDAWTGEAKVAGTASPLEAPWWQIHLNEVVVTRLGVPADHLVIESWHPGRGLEAVDRY